MTFGHVWALLVTFVTFGNADFAGTTSTSGGISACYVDGPCVRTNYADNQECQIQARHDLTLNVTSFSVEGSSHAAECAGCNCDYLCGDLLIHFSAHFRNRSKHCSVALQSMVVPFTVPCIN